MNLEQENDAKASQYKKIRELGKGGGGVVYLMVHFNGALYWCRTISKEIRKLL